MHEQFIGQTLTPVPGSFATNAMAIGAPALPKQFTWRKDTIEVAEILQEWRESGPCRNGSREQYLRKHWFRIRTADGTEMKLYFERQPRGRKKDRWNLYSLFDNDDSLRASQEIEDH